MRKPKTKRLPVYCEHYNDPQNDSSHERCIRCGEEWFYKKDAPKVQIGWVEVEG